MAGLTGVPGCCSESGPWGASLLQRGTEYNDSCGAVAQA